jgi:hypothetical protein
MTFWEFIACWLLLQLPLGMWVGSRIKRVNS